MSDIIRATIKREQVEGRVLQKIELDMVDEDDEDIQRHICTIYVDEMEISEDFVTELYKGFENK